MRTLKVTALAALLLAGTPVRAADPKPAPKTPPKQVVTGPVAVYWISAQTASGFGAGMTGGGGKTPSAGDMMRMMMGGRGGGAQKALTLQLGSSHKPAGPPEANHLPPEGLGAGPSLPLVTPQAVRAEPAEPGEQGPELPREYRKPKGRMLIFWGCGETARPGQPVVIDFAQMADGKLPPGLAALGRGIDYTPMRPPSPTRNATYGEWPNAKTRTSVPSEGSLVGEHVVRGGYSPEIRFALNASQDFLGPLTLTTNSLGPSGAGLLGWSPVAGAQGYLAMAVGGAQDTVVIWTSSEIQAAAFALPDYLSNADLARLVASRALMGPQTTRCAIPKEAVAAAPQALVQMTAYGAEANFASPPRPQDPAVPWNIDWTVKVRYRSQTGGILGMADPFASRQTGQSGQSPPDGEGGGPAEGKPPPAKPPARRPGLGDIMRGLGGIPIP